MSIRLDIRNALSATIGSEGLSRDDVSRIFSRLETYNGFLKDAPIPFMELPFQPFQIPEMEGLKKKVLSNDISTFLLLGIGGSALGTEALCRALLHPLHNEDRRFRAGKPAYFILDNIDPHRIAGIAEAVQHDPDHTMMVVISKSGTTAETLSQFMIFKDLLKSSPRYADRVVLITDQETGILNTISRSDGFPVLNLPKGIGGRFSVLTPVGLFPAMMLGIDVHALLEGARAMADHIASAGPATNLAVSLSALLLGAYARGKTIHVVMPYSDRLISFADWFRQLEAESLGKNEKGPLPVRSVGVTDQHSQLQLYMDGPRDKFILFLTNNPPSLPIPDSFPEIPDLAYLAGADLGNLFSAEFRGTRRALREASRPTATLHLSHITPFTMGALFFLFEMVTAFMGHCMEINPFDQPAVELGKEYTRQIMRSGKPSDDSPEAEEWTEPFTVISSEEWF